MSIRVSFVEVYSMEDEANACRFLCGCKHLWFTNAVICMNSANSHHVHTTYHAVYAEKLSLSLSLDKITRVSLLHSGRFEFSHCVAQVMHSLYIYRVY